MKKVVGIIGILILGISSMAVYGILTAKDRSVNTITAGDNEIQIVETYEPPKEIVPGQTITKNVAIKNTGMVTCFVRVKVFLSNEELLPYLHFDYQNVWILGPDGYYYYPKPLSSGMCTSPLFTKVVIEPESDEAILQEMKQLSIDVYGESCQKGNAKEYGEAWKNIE